MEEPKNKWKGLRAIVVVRQSDDKDGTASTAAQLDYMAKELDRVGLLWVDKKVLEGVKASAPATVTAIVEELFRRKREKNDFDVIAWQVEDRASRGGGEHGMWLEHEAKRRGLRVFIAGDDQIAGPYAPVVRVAKYEAAKESSVNNGRRSRQGQSWAKKQGFFRTPGQTPIGCDRLYLSAEDRPKCIIHNLSNGLQEQRDWVTRQVIGNFGTIGKKSRNRFKKQRNEYSLLIPGDREQQQVVRVIFYLRYKRGWRGCKIADFLNRNGVPSPKGKEWSQRQVQVIYENESYTGCSYGDQTYSGRFFKGDKTLGFVPLNRDEIELVMKKTFSPQLRPMDEWDRVDQPYMYDFLPRDVRDLAITAMATIWKERTDPARPKRKTNAHPASEYLLSGKLRAVQDGKFLTGTLSGKKGQEKQYYRHPRSKKGRRKGSIFNKLIPAEPLHIAIINVLADTLQDTPELRAKLTQFVLDQRSAADQSQPDVLKLEAERDDIQQQIDLIVSTLSGAALKAVASKLHRLGDRRNAIESQLDAARTDHTKDVRSVEAVVEDAIAVLADDRKKLLTLPVEPLRDLVNRLVIQALVDMESKAVTITVALPTWAAAPTQRLKKIRDNTTSDADNEVCPPSNLRSQSGGWTHHALTAADCKYRAVRGSRKAPCYDCQRKAA